MSIVEQIFYLIRNEIKGEPLPDNTRYDMQKIYTLSKRHDIAHLIGDALFRNKLLPDDKIGDAFKEQMMMAVIRVEQQTAELERIKQAFDNAKIPYIPLKGAVIRDMYPKPWMRTSCDIDILVHEEDLDIATEVLNQQLEYKQLLKGSHDISFENPAGIHIELHYDLIEKDVNEKAEKPLKDVWKYSYAKHNTVHYYMFDEMFYYYHIAHMAKHFVHGGCGIRPLIDLWLLNHKSDYNDDKRKELLKEGGLLDFERAVVRLSEVWLSEETADELTEKIQNFVIIGGVYGNLENRIAVGQQKKGGKFHYIISRIFLPYSVLKFQYPVLQKHKWLLPFMEVRRWFKLIFKGGLKRSAREIKINRSMPLKMQAETTKMMEQLGL